MLSKCRVFLEILSRTDLLLPRVPTLLTYVVLIDSCYVNHIGIDVEYDAVRGGNDRARIPDDDQDTNTETEGCVWEPPVHNQLIII